MKELKKTRKIMGKPNIHLIRFSNGKKNAEDVIFKKSNTKNFFNCSKT